MPYVRPTLGQLVARAGAKYRTRFPGADLNQRHSPDRAIVEVVAGGADEGLGYLHWQKDQLFPFSADEDYVERWAAMKGVRRKRATPFVGTVALTGTPNKTALAGTELQSASGVVVALSADATLGEDGTVAAAVEATTGGEATNLEVDASLTFIGTPEGFSDAGAVTVVNDLGAEAESIASLRFRTLRAYSRPSFGGNENNWQDAALALPGVTAVYTSPATPTPGAITIWPLFDDLRENGIPVGTNAWIRPGGGVSGGIGGTGDQRAVLDALLAVGSTTPRPVCAHLYVAALATHPIDIVIDDLQNDTPELRLAIRASLHNMFLRRRGPAKPVSKSWIGEAISRAAGEESHNLPTPAGNVSIAAGTIAVLGNISYT